MTTTDEQQIIAFETAGQRFAVHLRHVLEVQPLGNMSPVPCTPSFIVGVVNLRGNLHAVVDLGAFFGLPPVNRTATSRVLLTRASDLEVGILADQVFHVAELHPDNLELPLALQQGIPREYVRGIVREPSALLLDLDRLFLDPRLIVDEEIG